MLWSSSMSRCRFCAPSICSSLILGASPWLLGPVFWDTQLAIIPRNAGGVVICPWTSMTFLPPYICPSLSNLVLALDPSEQRGCEPTVGQGPILGEDFQQVQEILGEDGGI